VVVFVSYLSSIYFIGYFAVAVGLSFLCLLFRFCCQDKRILASKILATMVCVDVFLNAKHAPNMKSAGEQALKYVSLVLGLTKADLAASLKVKFDQLLAAPVDAAAGGSEKQKKEKKDKAQKKDKKDKDDKTQKMDKKDKDEKQKEDTSSDSCFLVNYLF
jgi:hypothetical protein